MPAALNTRYLNLDLAHPFLVGASPLIYDLDQVRRLEDAGASCIVMHSLFAEQVEGRAAIPPAGEPPAQARARLEAQRFPLDPPSYLEHIHRLRQAIRIPVIASLNGVHDGDWVEFGRQIQEAGAHALELNLYFLPRDSEEPSQVIEDRAVSIVHNTCRLVTLPVAVKISPFFTSVGHLGRRLEAAGAQALVLFNHLYQPDIDLDNLRFSRDLHLTEREELLLRLRWTAVLHQRLKLQLAVTGGAHTAEDLLKALAAGANVVQIVSALLRHGPQHLASLLRDVQVWMAAHDFSSVDQLRGILSFARSDNPERETRAQYMQLIRQWRLAQ